MPIPMNPLVADMVAKLPAALAEDFEERAAIMEFDGEMQRPLAEALALLDVIHRHPDALSGLHVARLRVRGESHYVITTDPQRFRGLHRPSNPGVILHLHFGGAALLAPLEGSR